MVRHGGAHGYVEKDKFPVCLSAFPDHMLETMDRRDEAARWARWMAAAQDGDGAAYARLLAELLPVVRRMVRRRWPRAEDSEDVVQEVLLTLHAVRHTYDPARPFLPWLSAIVAHRVADGLRRHHRQGGRERALDDVPETFLSVEANTDSVDAPSLRSAVTSLPEGQRRAVEMVKLKEMSLAEASAATGMTPGALKVAVHRAIKSLKAILARDDP